MTKVLVIAEHDEAELAPATLRTIGAAQQLGTDGVDLLVLAGDGSGQPIEISAPLDLDLALSGTSLEETLSGELGSLTGNVGVGLGEGGIEGGVFGRVQEALGQLAGQGLSLPAELSEAFSLQFHGFSGQLAIADGRVERIANREDLDIEVTQVEGEE